MTDQPTEDTTPLVEAGRGLQEVGAAMSAEKIPKLAGYRAFILGLAPFVLALTAIIALAVVRPDLLSLEALISLLGIGTAGPITGGLLRSVDKRTSVKRLEAGG